MPFLDKNGVEALSSQVRYDADKTYERKGLALTNAAVGQYIKVASVDSSGIPISYDVDNLEDIREDIAALEAVVKGINIDLNTWYDIAGLADLSSDVKNKYIGLKVTDTFVDRHTSSNTKYDCDFVLQNFQKVELQDTSKINAAILGMLYALPFATQFDEYEAFYSVPSGGLEAGSYYFTYGVSWGGKIVSGSNYSFTTTLDHPEEAQLVFSGNPQSVDVTTLKVYIYDTKGGTVKAEECTISSGIAEGATQLCTLSTSQIGSNDQQNHLHRICYGNNNWAESAIRQFLNSSAAAGEWWTPQNKWDRPPNYANYPGFLTMLPADLVELLQTIRVDTALSYSADAGTSSDVRIVTTYDKVFLPSWEQHYLKVDANYGGYNGAEGEAFEYWKQVAGVSTPWAAGTTHAEYIHYALENHNTARSVFLRSPLRSGGSYVPYIYASGYCNYGSAVYGVFVVPVFAIRQSVSS